jgi:hypothetical protein
VVFVSTGAGLAILLILGLGLLFPLVLYSLVRSETDPERMDRETAVRTARRDSPGGRSASGASEPDREWGADSRSDDGGWGDGSDDGARGADSDDGSDADPWNR